MSEIFIVSIRGDEEFGFVCVVSCFCSRVFVGEFGRHLLAEGDFFGGAEKVSISRTEY